MEKSRSLKLQAMAYLRRPQKLRMNLFKKSLLLSFFLGLTAFLSAQDTLWVQTLTWDSAVRRGVWEFPNDPGQSFRKILMYYNMRCHDAKVGNGNVGCYEWDYSCNTFLTDSSRTDSSIAFQNNYDIRGFSDQFFEYSTQPTYTYYQYNQKDAVYSSVSNERKFPTGNPDTPLRFDAEEGCYRGQFLYTVDELTAAGLRAGNIHAIELPVSAPGAILPYLRVRLKSISDKEINPSFPHTEGWTEVYFKDTEFNAAGNKRLQFYTPFNWNGTSSILVDISFSKFNKAAEPLLGWQTLTSDKFSIGTGKAERSLVSDGSSAKLTGGKLSNFSKEITVSFWSYGTAHLQPSNGSIIEGFDAGGNRALNIHLPWSNGGIYFDCGFQGGSYDRVEKGAAVKDYEGAWIHWAFTKNTQTGSMSIYRNGSLFVSSTGRTKAIDLSTLQIGEALGYDGVYYGRIRELSLWNKELDSLTIREWAHRTIQPGHPAYANLVYYFDMQTAAGTDLPDLAPNAQAANLTYLLGRHQERGDKMLMNFKSSLQRPAISFVTGNYSGFRVDELPVRDSIQRGPSRVREYRVENNNLILDSTYWLFKSGDETVYFETGDGADVIYIEPEGSLQVDRLKYYLKRPAKFELLSLVTPYGNGLDLGKDGKTFVFDLTDFTPVLRGKKLLTMEMGGEWQEEIDIRFAFIKGTPEREILDISNIWPFDRGYFSEITGNTKFEPREMALPAPAAHYELRLSVTGHEQNGEFTPKKHFINASGNGSRKQQFDVWKECASNPIYPQGGTWLIDRAGWCPGAATDLHRFVITPQVAAGGKVTLDYGVELPALTQANYLVSAQVVSYGPYRFKNDLSLEEILRPSTGRVEFERLNPSCSNPIISIRNSGSEILKSCVIQYGKKGGKTWTHNWTGNLNPSATIQVVLPVPEESYLGNDPTGEFEVTISQPNGQMDENPENNRQTSLYRMVDTYGTNLHFEFKTNGVGADSRYRIVNSKGEVVIQRTGMAGNTIYREELNLPPGCYTIFVEDQSHDGLYFWFYSNLGSGFARLSRKVNTNYATLKNFNPDFGSGFQYDFVIQEGVATRDEWTPKLLSIAPNPASDQTFIHLQADQAGPVSLELLNDQGIRVGQKVYQTNAGELSISWELGSLPSGLYLLRISQNGKSLVRKIVKE